MKAEIGDVWLVELDKSPYPRCYDMGTILAIAMDGKTQAILWDYDGQYTASNDFPLKDGILIQRDGKITNNVIKVLSKYKQSLPSAEAVEKRNYTILFKGDM